MKQSELVLANDGSLYHIHLKEDDLADDIFLVGDPERVNMFKDLFDEVILERSNRELHSVTGLYKGHRFTALSTGMGTDNIDIVLTELDACVNMDLSTRESKKSNRCLNLIRIGTSGSLHSGIPVGSLVASEYALGLDGLLNYYVHETSAEDQNLAEEFQRHMQFDSRFATPYAAHCGKNLLEKVAFDMHHGITATAPGFYAPQGRNIRIAPSITDLNEKLASFAWEGLKVTNLEMETSAIYGLSNAMGHQALTVCLIIANRPDGTFLSDYHPQMKETIIKIMDRLA